METDYRFNLDKLYRHSCDLIPIIEPLDIIPLTKKQAIFLKRSMIRIPAMYGILDTLSEHRRKQKIFMRLSTRSAKDANINWDTEDPFDLLQTFVRSGRIQEDLEEAIRRKKNLSLIILPFIQYGDEYRSFVNRGEYTTTRSDQGVTMDISKDPFQSISSIAQRLISFYGRETDFVFDMGINTENGKLQLIECNQLDEDTDPYKGLPQLTIIG